MRTNYVLSSCSVSPKKICNQVNHIHIHTYISYRWEESSFLKKAFIFRREFHMTVDNSELVLDKQEGFLTLSLFSPHFFPFWLLPGGKNCLREAHWEDRTSLELLKLWDSASSHGLSENSQRRCLVHKRTKWHCGTQVDVFSNHLVLSASWYYIIYIRLF